MDWNNLNRIVYPEIWQKKVDTEDSKHALEANLSWKINSLEDALWYIRQIALKCERRTDKSQRAKYRAWNSIYNSFFRELGISKYRADWQKWRLETIKTVSDLFGVDSIPDMENLSDDKKVIKKWEIISKLFKEIEDWKERWADVQEFLLLLQEEYIFSKYKKAS